MVYCSQLLVGSFLVLVACQCLVNGVKDCEQVRILMFFDMKIIFV